MCACRHPLSNIAVSTPQDVYGADRAGVPPVDCRGVRRVGLRPLSKQQKHPAHQIQAVSACARG